MLGTFLALGGFWALKAQDPAPQQTPTTPTTQTEKQTMTKTAQLDLSGTYAGTFANCEGLNGDTTLTITGDQFTTADGKSGRIIASKTKGYTAVALQMSGANSPVMSFRGKKSGNKLTLSPVAGATSQCTFTTSKMAKTPTATGTEVANPSTTTPSTTPSQNPSPSPSPEASPEPNPSPSGSPRPRPNPSPTEPMPSPTPTPSPSPRI
ncbi:MAG TPA: hypothetical protein VFH96_10765 [Pyrinomonadaceae bacterium]|nr:hypothetical protein [Pyrinomonadaceae bacterium]